MTYATEEQRKEAKRESRRRYRLKTYKPVEVDKRKLRTKKEFDKRYDMLWAAKHRAKKIGREFDIKVEDVVIPEFCPILGIKLNLNNSSTSFDSPSLDRLDSSKGYTQGNIFVISWRANKLKSDASFSEIEKIFLWMKEKA